MLRQALARDQIRLYMAQSALLSVLAVVIAADRNLPDLYVLAALSAGLKVVAVAVVRPPTGIARRIRVMRRIRYPLQDRERHPGLDGRDPAHLWSLTPRRPLGGSGEAPQPRYGCYNLHTLWCTVPQPYIPAGRPAAPAAPAL